LKFCSARRGELLGRDYLLKIGRKYIILEEVQSTLAAAGSDGGGQPPKAEF